jgi:multicomponent Na+:H+ antiporter subunit D
MLESRSAVAGLGFLVVGLSIKLAVFPLHQWLPNAYTFAPPKVSAFIAGTATKVSYYLLLQVIFTVFGAGFVFDRLRFDDALVPLSLTAMFVGSLAAIYQADVRRLLAYSSIAQVGYMTLGLSLHNLNGLTGGIVHLLNHGLTKSGLFLVVAAMAHRMGSTEIRGLAGVGRRMPLTTFALVIGGASLIGVPGTAGFVSKWYFVLGALERGQLWIAVAVLLSSLLAVVYVWRLVEVAYFQSPAPESREAGLPERGEAPLAMLLPIYLLIGAVVVFGFWTGPTAGVARQAAAELLGVLP